MSYMEFLRISDDRTCFLKTGVGAAMETNAKTWAAFNSYRKLAVPFGRASFVLDYHNDKGDLSHTIALTDKSFEEISGELSLTDAEYRHIDNAYWRECSMTHAETKAPLLDEVEKSIHELELSYPETGGHDILGGEYYADKIRAHIAAQAERIARLEEQLKCRETMTEAELHKAANNLAFKIRTNYVGHGDAAIEQMLAVNRGTEWIIDLAKKFRG